MHSCSYVTIDLYPSCTNFKGTMSRHRRCLVYLPDSGFFRGVRHFPGERTRFRNPPNFWISEWSSGFKLDFCISQFSLGFQDFTLDFSWIPRFDVGFLDLMLDFWIQCWTLNRLEFDLCSSTMIFYFCVQATLA